MPKGSHRRYGLRHLQFITCSCNRRLPLFAPTRAKDLFVRIFGEVRYRYGFALAGYVVITKSIPLLIGEPARGTPSTVMQVLKQHVSRRTLEHYSHIRMDAKWTAVEAISQAISEGIGAQNWTQPQESQKATAAN